jgi:N-glycosylase/DNA lyase
MPNSKRTSSMLSSVECRVSSAPPLDTHPSTPAPRPSTLRAFPIQDYDLTATFSCGQAFRWRQESQSWIGVIGARWVRLTAEVSSIAAETAEPVSSWDWLVDYLQLDLDLCRVLASFPDDEPMRTAVTACRGLRLLRQDLWECLASFILSSTKQIVQIRQIISSLCERYGEPVRVPMGFQPVRAFPTAARLAGATENELRACKMGFRAPYLLATARAIDGGHFDLNRVRALPANAARAELMQLPGVGRKIADCVLLFACGRQAAFPLDVWLMRSLRQLYFPGKHVSLSRLHRFAATHFGPYAGYAQQYLFHHARTGVPAQDPISEDRRPKEARSPKSKVQTRKRNTQHAIRLPP